MIPPSSTSDVILRPYRSGDGPRLSALYAAAVHAAGPRAYSAAQTEAWASLAPEAAAYDRKAADGRLFLVAADAANAPVAYGDLEADGHVDHLYCAPQWQGRGLGSALLVRLEAGARARGMNQLYAEASELALPVFLRCGFVQVRRRTVTVGGVDIHNHAVVKVL